MRHPTFELITLLLVTACTDQSTPPLVEADAPRAQVGQGRIVHRVSVGGPDQCSSLGLKPGCDGSFSLVAMQWEDGSVTGEFTDSYGGPGALHATVDCLLVQVIPERTTLEAWVGGVMTHPKEAAGHRVITRMRDNGTSKNDPRPDAISRGIVDPERENVSSNCQDKPDMGFAQALQGQVTIW